MTSIRLRRNEDLAGCAEALRVVYELNGYPVGGVEDPAGFLSTDDLAWVAESDGKVMGHIALTKASADDVSAALWWEQHPGDTRISVLGRLFVHPDGRKGGTASRLIQTAVDECRERSHRLVMFALIKDKDAIRLYHRLGWEYFGSTTYRWGEGDQMAAECFASPTS